MQEIEQVADISAKAKSFVGCAREIPESERNKRLRFIEKQPFSNVLRMFGISQG
ncbi:MAG: hypothetical protein ABIA93_06270 [Candidatus Woesearchaeota archaeon]